MDEYPKMLYRCPGAELMHGGYFSTMIVADAEAEADALMIGWRTTTTAAKAQAEAPPEPVAPLAEPPKRGPGRPPKAQS